MAPAYLAGRSRPDLSLGLGLKPIARLEPPTGLPPERGRIPMSLMQRISLIFRAKANKALDRAEDPRETLDYSYQRQLELLSKVRRGVADVATSRKRVELQVNQLQGQATKLQDQAQKAIQMGREDLAREALTRKSGLAQQMSDLQAQHSQLQGEAETKINEAMSGIGEEMGDVGMAIQRAEDKTAQMQARAGAIDELIASGALEDFTGGGQQDDIQAELDRMSSSSDVELEMQRLRGEIGQAAPAQIESAPSGAGKTARAGEAGTTGTGPTASPDTGQAGTTGTAQGATSNTDGLAGQQSPAQSADEPPAHVEGA